MARVVVAALLLAAATTVAGADPARGPRWESPAGCPDAAAALALVDAERGAPWPDDAPAIQVIVAPTAGAWEAVVVADAAGGDAERRVGGRTCAEVTDAAVLIVALLVPAPPRTPTPPPAAAPRAPRPAPADAVPAPPPATRGTRVAVRALIGRDLASLPADTTSGTLAIALLRGRWRFVVGGARLAARATSSMPESAAVSLWAASAQACLGARRVALCAGGEAGAMSGAGVGFSHMRSAASPWLAVSGGAVLSLPLGATWSLQTEADLLAPVMAPRFVTDDGRPLYSPPALGARLWIGVEALIF